tara:strand:+ start:2013 stop:2660 length:648 start_codon:yes stop_codon:yes gene_type:complete
MFKINYSTTKYPFNKIISNILNTKNLSKIHKEFHFENYQLFTREKDQSTKYHKLYYDNFKESIEPLYKEFIKEIIKPLYSEDIVYQKIPTFRLHFPGNIAVGEYHKDKWYRDLEWHEEVKEMNFFLPFTRAYGTNTIWVESEEDEGDYKPMNIKYGEFVQWDGSNLSHGNKKNITQTTRVSVDFRVMPYSTYKPSNHGSINTKTKFEIGGYYDII